MTTAHLNRIATRAPANDGHRAFLDFGRALLDERSRRLFDRMASRSQIAHRYSVLAMDKDPEGHALDARQFYVTGRFPSTAERMRVYERHARELAIDALAGLDLGTDARKDITHLIVTSCTGMYAPGVDLDLVALCGLNPSVERTLIGFMGCYAAINALKLSRHIIRSAPSSRVLLLNLELCSLHLQETTDFEQMLSFLLFGDGCAASLVTAEPVGFSLDRFHAEVLPDTHPLITWKVGDNGFDMFLSGKVPAAISKGLEQVANAVLEGARSEAIDLWAVHPGGRSILDAVEAGLGLPKQALNASRRILEQFGNMSSATVMFVLEALLASSTPGQRGCAMAFGPGLTAETLLFHKV